MIGVAVGPPSPNGHIPDWRRERGATVPECVHARAPMWLGPACNLGIDPGERLIPGWEIEAGCVTCAACRLLAGGAR